MLNPQTNHFYPDAEKFIRDVYAYSGPLSFFMNMVYLAKLSCGVQSKRQNYTGPRGMDDFFNRVQANEYKTKQSQDLAYKLAVFYDSLNDERTKKFLEWVLALLPLKLSSSFAQEHLAEVHLRETDCYNKIVLENKAFSDQKFNYELLCKIISNLEIQGLNNADNRELYAVARFFRSICPYVLASRDPRILAQRVRDNAYQIPDSIPASKQEFATRALNATNTQLALSLDSESDITQICATANQIAQLSQNPKLVRRTQELYDAQKIIDIPKIAMDSTNDNIR